jgi:hypothetical protein
MYTTPQKISAVDAQAEALKIAFAPFTFQATHALLKLGILECVSNAGEQGMPPEAIAAHCDVSLYGVKVLLDMGLSAHLVWLDGDNYVLDKVGHFMVSDNMARVNLDFAQDVCYEGLFHLLDSIKTGKPKGLKVFGDWPTIYPALSELPEPAKQSWFDFDHYYSSKAFPEILATVFAQPIKRMVDIGGNTGKWAIACAEHNPDVQVTIVDLPEQVKVLETIMAEKGLTRRVNLHEANLLDPQAALPTDADAIWVSQFLDCFGEDEILSILQRIAASMTDNTRLYILELFYDRQKYEAAAFSINATSLYFTAMANGNSRMYHSKDLLKLIQKAGLYVDEDIDHIGAGHTLLCCKRKPV